MTGVQTCALPIYHYCSSVLHDKHVYGFSSGILTAMELMTGNVAWRERSVGKGQLILGEGLLYLQGETGTVALAEATPTAYKELSRFEFGRGEYPLWTLPVIANGLGRGILPPGHPLLATRARSLALREFALGIESLERFARKEPLRRVHEAVFGVLALESEPVDPRL